jgi:hypothetical protein
MLRGCQSADNQFQALQNQEIEDFSIHGSRLPELEAEVVQIQPLQISLRYLISRIWYLEDLCSSLLGHLQTFLYFPIVLDFRKFMSVDIITLFTQVLLRPLGGVIVVWFFSLLCFTLCPFVTKRGSNFWFGPGMYFQTGQVIFVPEWPKGVFVSILASFCV